MAELLYIEPAFVVDDISVLSQTDLTSCVLLVTAGSGQFGYAVFDPSEKRFITLKSYYYEAGGQNRSSLDMIAQCLNQDKLLYTAFRETRIGFDVAEHTLIPRPYLEMQQRREYLSFLFGEQPDHVALADLLPGTDVVNLYSVHKNELGFLKKEFATERVWHIETAYLQSLLADPRLKDGTVLCLRVLPDRIVLSLMRDAQLLYQQSFAFRHEMDIVYHTLNVCRQFECDMSATRVLLSGEIPDDSPVFIALHTYIPLLEWLERPSDFHYVESFLAYPSHHFYGLAALALCGS